MQVKKKCRKIEEDMERMRARLLLGQGMFGLSAAAEGSQKETAVQFKEESSRTGWIERT